MSDEREFASRGNFLRVLYELLTRERRESEEEIEARIHQFLSSLRVHLATRYFTELSSSFPSL